MEQTTIAIDIAKSVFQVAVSSRRGSIETERRLSRDRVLTYFAQQPPTKVVLEACGSAHHWARQLQQLGHTVRLLPAYDVHRYAPQQDRSHRHQGAVRGRWQRRDSRCPREDHRSPKPLRRFIACAPVGCRNPGSRGADVLVNDSAETIPAHNASAAGCRRRCGRRLCRRWRQGQGAMWPVPVVVIDELFEDPLKVLLVENQQPAETL